MSIKEQVTKKMSQSRMKLSCNDVFFYLNMLIFSLYHLFSHGIDPFSVITVHDLLLLITLLL